jgi:hypothetical protein
VGIPRSRDDGGASARLVLENGANPEPSTFDGEVVFGVFSAGDTRTDAEAAALGGIDAATVLVGMELDGAVGTVKNRGNLCSEDTIIGLGDATLNIPDVDTDNDDFDEFYQPTLRLVIEKDSDTAVGTLTFRTSLAANLDDNLTVPLTLVREEGAVTKAGPCRDNRDDGTSNRDFLDDKDVDSGGGID